MPRQAPGETETTRYLSCRLLVSGTTDLVVSWLTGEITATPEEIVTAVVSTGAGPAPED